MDKLYFEFKNKKNAVARFLADDINYIAELSFDNDFQYIKGNYCTLDAKYLCCWEDKNYFITKKILSFQFEDKNEILTKINEKLQTNFKNIEFINN